MAESDTPPPAASEDAGPVTDSPGARRVVAIALAAMAVIAVIAVLVLRPWEGGTPGPDPTPTDSGTTSSPSAQPSDTPTTPAPGETTAPAQPVPIESPGTITPGLTAQILGIEAVDGVAKGPGEVSGPSIRFTVTITNGNTAAVDLTSTVVTVDYGADRTPAGQLFQPGASPMPTTVTAGSAVSGVYVFSIPTDQRGLVNITVDYSVGVPPLVFSGPVP